MTAVESFDTPRMHLRGLDPSDESVYCALYTDPQVMAHIAPPLLPAAARTGFFAACGRNADPAATQRYWTILARDRGVPLGLLAVFLGPAGRDAEFGVMLLPAAQGGGRALELCHALFARAFGPAGWGLHRLWARHAAGHAAVMAVMAAAGFEPGSPVDGYATGEMTRERWAGGAE